MPYVIAIGLEEMPQPQVVMRLLGSRARPVTGLVETSNYPSDQTANSFPLGSVK